MMKKKLIVFPLLIFLTIFFVFFYLLIIERDSSEIPSALINKKVPIFTAKSLVNKEIFVSSDEFDKKTTIVNFFATWCGPCREEHVYLKKLSNEKKFKIIGINYKDDAEKTIKWLNKLGNPYSNVISDDDGRLGIEWGVYGIPETFVVNSNGIIKYKLIGPITKKKYKKFYLKALESEK